MATLLQAQVVEVTQPTGALTLCPMDIVRPYYLIGNIMSTQQNAIKHQVNNHGTSIRQVTVYSSERVTELFYQLVAETWIPYKRIVHVVH